MGIASPWTAIDEPCVKYGSSVFFRLSETQTRSLFMHAEQGCYILLVALFIMMVSVEPVLSRAERILVWTASCNWHLF